MCGMCVGLCDRGEDGSRGGLSGGAGGTGSASASVGRKHLC